MSHLLIRTKTNEILNLSHSHDFRYDPEKQRLSVYWAFCIPSEDGTGCAEIYSHQRLIYYEVTPNDWEDFQTRAFK